MLGLPTKSTAESVIDSDYRVDLSIILAPGRLSLSLTLPSGV